MKNILFVLCDQMRFDTIHALGNSVIRTPVLDELTKNGVSFTKAYTPCPVCVPARYSLHTGKMPHETGVFENNLLPGEKTRKSFMNILAENGYQTFGAGKMHFTFPEGLNTLWGFEKRKVCDQDNDLEHNDFYQDIKKAGYGHVVDYKGVRSEMYYIPQVSQLPAEMHHTHWTADKCIEFLQERNEQKPFFIMASFEKPHPPFEPPVPWNKLYRGPDMPLPKVPVNSENMQTIWNKFQNRYKYRDNGLDLNLIRQIKAHYYAEISYVDYNLGRLLDMLRQKNLLKDTLIIFTSDHGEMLGDYNCFGKRCFLDSAARVPLIMVEPNESENKICSTPVSLIDIYPTILQYAGIDVEEQRTKVNPKEVFAGESLSDIAKGKTNRCFVVGQYEQDAFANYMLLDSDFKYIYSAPDNKEILIDTINDPNELQNKAENPLYKKKTQELRKKLIDYFVENGYCKAQESGRWKKYANISLMPDADAYLLFQDPKDSIPHIDGYTTYGNQKSMYEFTWLNNSFDG